MMIHGFLFVIYILNEDNFVYCTTSASRTNETEEINIFYNKIVTAPIGTLQVVYNGLLDVNFGNELPSTMIENEPEVTWKAEPNTYYTLCLVSPDCPNLDSSEYIEWPHWIVGNIHENNVNKGEVLLDYIGAYPKYDPDLQRFIFLLYKQNNKTDFPEYLKQTRWNFTIDEFTKKYHLGYPVARNYFYCKPYEKDIVAPNNTAIYDED